MIRGIIMRRITGTVREHLGRIYYDERRVSGTVFRIFGIAAAFGIVSMVVMAPAESVVFRYAAVLVFTEASLCEVLERVLYRRRRQFLKQLDSFFDSVRHYYFQCGNVTEAVWIAIEDAGDIVRLHGMCIYEAVTAEDAAQECEIYMERCKDRHLRLFMALVRRLDEEGDYEFGDGSGFMTAITGLRQDVQVELRYLQRKQHMFAGFSLTAILPLAAVPYITSWGSETVEGMAAFYCGTGGMLVSSIILFVCRLCHKGVLYIKTGENLLGIPAVQRLCNRVSEWRILGGIQKRKLRSMCYCLVGAGVTVLIGTEIDEFFDNIAVWPAVMVIAGSAGWFFPVLTDTFRRTLEAGGRQEEVLRFQSVISVQAEAPGADIVSVLENMEEFSELYRPVLRQCLSEISVNGVEALCRLRDSEAYVPFRHLVDCLIMADEIGIKEAFCELNYDIKGFRESNRAEREQLLEDQSSFAMLMAVLPGLTVLFGYLLVPFLHNALSMFENYAAQIEALL